MRIFLMFAAVICFVASGCDKSGSTANTSETKNSTSHEHKEGDGAHEHKEVSSHVHADGTECTCEHGPNNGYVFKFDNENYKGEWVQSKDNDVVRFYLLNAMDENSALKVDSFTVTSLAGSDGASFELAAENPDDNGKSHVFMADEKELRIAIPLGVTVEVKSGDLVLKGTIEAHEPKDH